MAKEKELSFSRFSTSKLINGDNVVAFLTNVELENLAESQEKVNKLESLVMAEAFQVMIRTNLIPISAIIDYILKNAVEKEFIGNINASDRYTFTKMIFKDGSECEFKNIQFEYQGLAKKIAQLTLNKEAV